MASLFTWLTAPGTAIIENEIENKNTYEPTFVDALTLSPAAKIAFAELNTRWTVLEIWGETRGGLLNVAPSLKGQHAFWVEYRDSWLAGKPDVTKTLAATADLYAAEQIASALGYQNKFNPAPVVAPAIDEATSALKAAAAVDKAVPTIPGLAKKIPWYVYAGAVGAAIVAGAIGVVVLRNSPQARVARML